MSLVKLIGVALIVLGTLGLIYGGFSYTKASHDVKLGPIELSIQEKQRINVPLWAGVGAIAVGAVLLLLGGNKR